MNDAVELLNSGVSKVSDRNALSSETRCHLYVIHLRSERIKETDLKLSYYLIYSRYVLENWSHHDNSCAK